MALNLIDPQDSRLTFNIEEDGPEIRRLWVTYASSKYKDLLDTEPADMATIDLPVAIPEVVKVEAPDLGDPVKKLGEVLKDKVQ